KAPVVRNAADPAEAEEAGVGAADERPVAELVGAAGADADEGGGAGARLKSDAADVEDAQVVESPVGGVAEVGERQKGVGARGGHVAPEPIGRVAELPVLTAGTDMIVGAGGAGERNSRNGGGQDRGAAWPAHKGGGSHQALSLEKQVERPAVTARRPGARILTCPVATTANHRQPGWLTGRAAPAGEGRQSGPLMTLPRT